MVNTNIVQNVMQRLDIVNNIYDITPFTLQDYPETVSCIVWFSGCNMVCKYCHNFDMVFNHSNRKIEEEKVIDFLRSRIGKLDGVVLCGGEPTLYKRLYIFVRKIKKLGFKIKLDTNGSNLEAVKKILPYIDFVAVDFKSDITRFKNITQSSLFDKFYETLKYLIESNINLEVRTTYHHKLLNYETLNQMTLMLEQLGYKNSYYIQRANATENFNESYHLDIKKIKKRTFEIKYR